MKFKSLIFISLWAALLASCDFKLKPFSEMMDDTLEITIQRYDRIESLYLTTGDFSALQQMSTDYPNETRTLIEDVLGLGDVSDPQINSKLLRFYQDSTLQTVISDAEVQYANMSDLNTQLTEAFHTLKTWIPDIKIPTARWVSVLTHTSVPTILSMRNTMTSSSASRCHVNISYPISSVSIC